jgi:hypothetical protein
MYLAVNKIIIQPLALWAFLDPTRPPQKGGETRGERWKPDMAGIIKRDNLINRATLPF